MPTFGDDLVWDKVGNESLIFPPAWQDNAPTTPPLSAPGGKMGSTQARVPFLRVRNLLAVIAIATLIGCAGESNIVHDLTEVEANEILVVLEGEGIKSKKVAVAGRVVTYSVVVSGTDESDALRILVDNKLPKERSTGLEQVYPAGSGGLIPTKSEEKAKFLMALQGEIERKLKTLPGVVRAHVSAVMPDKDVIRDVDEKPPEATASVALVYNPVDEDGKAGVPKEDIQRLVAASLEDLKPENVTVIMAQNEPLKLVGRDDSGEVQPVVRGVNVFGLKLVDKKAAKKAKLTLGSLGVGAGVGLLLFVVTLIAYITQKRKLAQAQSKVDSLQRARREM
jgi:type III secretion protein J